MSDSRRWFQLSLKSLFLLTVVVAAFSAGYSLAERRADRAARQDKAAMIAEREARQNVERVLMETRYRLQAEKADGLLIEAVNGARSR